MQFEHAKRQKLHFRLVTHEINVKDIYTIHYR
jgi:hypothetical protein